MGDGEVDVQRTGRSRRGRQANPRALWIVKHGIKMTGAPAWSDRNDEELWATAAFLEKPSGMSEQEYAGL